MKRSKLLAVCLIGVLMAVGLVLMGCDDDSGCYLDNQCYISTFQSHYCNDKKCAVNKEFQKGVFSRDSGVKCDC
jgi:hypothetical protein